MTETERRYNPHIIGASLYEGLIAHPLQEAKTRFGRLPSEFGLVPEKEGRRQERSLNMEIGVTLTELLRDKGANLKQPVVAFYDRWHRNYRREFGVDMEAFLNLNRTNAVQQVLELNQDLFDQALDTDLGDHLLATGLIRKEVLNSIEPEIFHDKLADILTKRAKHSLAPSAEVLQARRLLAVHQLRTAVERLTGRDSFPNPPADLVRIYADEIAQCLGDCHRWQPLAGMEELRFRSGHGLEFAFATRDASYLDLGEDMGDCTSEKRPRQLDRHVENIYWTVFAWLLDRNYQILKVYYDNRFILKAHILPLFHTGPRRKYLFLAVDAIETSKSFRSDVAGPMNPELEVNRDEIFYGTLKEILRIAGNMGVEDVYAEKFSNTDWVRETLHAQSEIYIRPQNLLKIDELEDVLELGREICQQQHRALPEQVFMEIQFKNTQLMGSQHTASAKSFALLRGDESDSEPMKRVYGV